jgi:hypothetical protein
MVPHDYWMAERILQQKACLMKQSKPPAKEITNDKVFISEVLTPITYTQANLEQVAQDCADLSIDQKSSLL